ncbi:MAG: hypothetical protein HZB76_00025 [Chlamydiae bacterium]|nr:hypothetical protein [Chlamydiota bacterium]
MAGSSVTSASSKSSRASSVPQREGLVVDPAESPQRSTNCIPKLKVINTQNTYNIIGCDPQSNSMANRVADLARSVFEITVKPYNIQNQNNQLNDLSDFRMHFWGKRVIVVYKENDENEKTWTVDLEENNNFNVEFAEKKPSPTRLDDKSFPKKRDKNSTLSIRAIGAVALKGDQVGRVNNETLKTYEVNLGLKQDSSGATGNPSPTPTGKRTNGDSEEDGSHKVEDKSKKATGAAPAQLSDDPVAEVIGSVRHKAKEDPQAEVARGPAEALLQARTTAERQTHQSEQEIPKGLLTAAMDGMQNFWKNHTPFFRRKKTNATETVVNSADAEIALQATIAAEAAAKRESAQSTGSVDRTAGDLSVANTEAGSDGSPETPRALPESMGAFDERHAEAGLAEAEKGGIAAATQAAAPATATTDFGSQATDDTER